MNKAPASVPQTCPVICFRCRAPFDAMESGWCNCLVSRRSLVCPSCLHCFCAAPKGWKEAFWKAAPAPLWDRLRLNHGTAFDVPDNPDPAKTVRPLVLIVDDEPDIQRIALRAIGSLGYGTVLAKNGEEGLAMARKYNPDLVLTDAFMPGLDGREMCRRLKEDPATSGAKVVIMTSLYTSSRHKSEAFREFGADDYLSKPLEFGRLQQLLRQHLG